MKNALTKTELKLLESLKQGKTTKIIADEWCVSPHTIKNHKTNVCEKLGLKHVSELLSFASRFGMQFDGGGIKNRKFSYFLCEFYF